MRSRPSPLPRAGRWLACALSLAACTSAPSAPGPDAGALPDLTEVDAPAEDRVAPPEDRVAPPEDRVAPAEDRVAPPEDRVAPADSGPGCGGPGQVCCALDTCAAGGCCVRERCVAAGDVCPIGGVCAAGSCGSCGAAEQPCCTVGFQTRGCTAGSVRCWNYQCRACGGAGQACCPGNQCGGGGCCVEGLCVADGGECRSGVVEPPGRCAAGVCTGCGGAGQPCCGETGPFGDAETPACGPGFVCFNPMPPLPGATCRACGGVGQPCCADGRCDTGCCNALRDGTCVAVGAPCGLRDLGVCRRSGGSCDVPCGGPGQPCCAGSRCEGGGCCVTQTEPIYYNGVALCVAAGDACAPGQVCNGGVCGGGCGGPGQPCCQPLPPLTPYCSAPNVTCGAGCVPCGQVGATCCNDAFGGCGAGVCRTIPGRPLCPTCPPEPATRLCIP